MTDTKKEVLRTVKFVLFSLSAGIIEILTYTLMYELLAWQEWLSHLISLILSVVWNFTLNRKYTFKAVVNVPVAMLKVACFYIVFTPTSMWLGQLAVNGGWNGLLVEVLTMCANFVLEFLFFKFVVFRGKDEKTEK